jgi:hypothetical protein
MTTHPKEEGLILRFFVEKIFEIFEVIYITDKRGRRV